MRAAVPRHQLRRAHRAATMVGTRMNNTANASPSAGGCSPDAESRRLARRESARHGSAPVPCPVRTSASTGIKPKVLLDLVPKTLGPCSGQARPCRQMRGSVRVKRARHLVSYWTDEGMVITSYATGSSVVADALVSHVLAQCGDWTSVQALRDRLTGIPRATVDDLVRAMIEQDVLATSRRHTRSTRASSRYVA